MDEKKFSTSREYVVKDSGKREEYESGMRRDTQEGKPDYTLIHIPFLTRLAEHLGKGAIKYGEHNWMKANSAGELERFKKSALRHMMQWLLGESDEDHAAAVVFNLMAAEYVKDRIKIAAEKFNDFYQKDFARIVTEMRMEEIKEEKEKGESNE